MNLRKLRAFETHSKTYSFSNDIHLYGTYEFLSDLRYGELNMGHKYIVEEATQWRDNDDKEAYVGDIITWETTVTHRSFKGHVIYIPEKGGYYIATINSIKNQNYFSLYEMRYAVNVKIIGNVHQHPELLKNELPEN